MNPIVYYIDVFLVGYMIGGIINAFIKHDMFTFKGGHDKQFSHAIMFPFMCMIIVDVVAWFLGV